MKLPSKIFLGLAVAGIGVGIWVSETSAQLQPIWTLALPLGVISLGMFFLTWFMQGPVAGYDEDQSRKMSSPGRNVDGVPEPAEHTPHEDGLTAGHVN